MEDFGLRCANVGPFSAKKALDAYKNCVRKGELYYGTSDCLGTETLLSLNEYYDKSSAEFFAEFGGKVYAVRDLCTAKYLSRCAARKYGGHPIVYKVNFSDTPKAYTGNAGLFFFGYAFKSITPVDFHSIYKEIKEIAYSEGRNSKKRRYVYSEQARKRMLCQKRK